MPPSVRSTRQRRPLRFPLAEPHTLSLIHSPRPPHGTRWTSLALQRLGPPPLLTEIDPGSRPDCREVPQSPARAFPLESDPAEVVKSLLKGLLDELRQLRSGSVQLTLPLGHPLVPKFLSHCGTVPITARQRTRRESLVLVVIGGWSRWPRRHRPDHLIVIPSRHGALRRLIVIILVAQARLLHKDEGAFGAVISAEGPRLGRTGEREHGRGDQQNPFHSAPCL